MAELWRQQADTDAEARFTVANREALSFMFDAQKLMLGRSLSLPTS
jgi:hypothetical protein